MCCISVTKQVLGRSLPDSFANRWKTIWVASSDRDDVQPTRIIVPVMGIRCAMVNCIEKKLPETPRAAGYAVQIKSQYHHIPVPSYC